jgi:MFS transporter, DHA1 family, multidrug resistance protein
MTDRISSLVTFGRLLTSYGYYLVVPFLAVYVTKHLGMSPIQAGVLLAVLNLGRRGMGIPAGYLSDRFGARQIILLGLLLEVLAYLSFSVVRDFSTLVIACFIEGTGGCLYNVSGRSLLATSENQAKVAADFNLFYVTMHIGGILGPITYAWFVTRGQIHLSFLLSAILYATLLVAILIWSSPEPTAKGHRATRSFRLLADIVMYREFMTYCLLITGTWFVLIQLFVGLPLHVSHLGYSDQFIAFLNGTNAVLATILQYFYGRTVERGNPQKYLNLLGLGTFIIAIGWLILILPGQTAIYVSLCVVTVGEIMFVGVVDILGSLFAPPGKTGIYLGFSTFGWAVGSSVGSLLAGIGFDFSAKYQATNFFWIIISVIGFLVAVGIWSNKKFLSYSLKRT